METVDEQTQQRIERIRASLPENTAGGKYLRTPVGMKDGKMDVYTVLATFDVACNSRGHAIKKLLCSGLRGKGDVLQDLREAIDAVVRAIEVELDRQGHPATSPGPAMRWQPKGHWENHPDPRLSPEEWVREVEEEATRQSYVEWVNAALEQREEVQNEE